MPLLQLRSFSTGTTQNSTLYSHTMWPVKQKGIDGSGAIDSQFNLHNKTRATSLNTRLNTTRCLMASSVPLSGRAYIPQLLSSLENHVQPFNRRARALLETNTKTIIQPTRVSIKTTDALAECPPSYFPGPLTLPPIDYSVGDCILLQENMKGPVKREDVCEVVDPGAPGMGSLGYRIANHSITMASSGVLKESAKTNEYYMIHAIQSNLAIIRRTTNTLIRKLYDQLASNEKALSECKMRIDNAETHAATLDAMTERINTLVSNTTLKELCAINKDQEDISRIVSHLNSQLDKNIKTLDEAYAFGHDFSQRVMLYRSRLPALEKTMTVLKLKCDAIRKKIGN